MLELLLGQVPEAIYFALFMIFTKEIKTKRITFIVLMVIEYILAKYSHIFSLNFHILYTIMTFITMKVLYKEKTQIIDVFTFGIASIGLIITSAVSFLLFRPEMIVVAVSNRILLFIMLFILKKHLPKIEKLYKHLWNRNDKVNKKMKSATFRSLNIVVFNLMFYIINLGMMYAIFLRR